MANFGFESRTDDVLAGQDLSGKTALVMGGTSGIESPTTEDGDVATCVARLKDADG